MTFGRVLIDSLQIEHNFIILEMNIICSKA
jgi:hypothetical protein